MEGGLPGPSPQPAVAPAPLPEQGHAVILYLSMGSNAGARPVRQASAMVETVPVLLVELSSLPTTLPTILMIMMLHFLWWWILDLQYTLSSLPLTWRPHPIVFMTM